MSAVRFVERDCGLEVECKCKCKSEGEGNDEDENWFGWGNECGIRRSANRVRL
ncbi:hypothetical protein ACFQO4_15355 [Saliphagus sp. GCM10025334]